MGAAPRRVHTLERKTNELKANEKLNMEKARKRALAKRLTLFGLVCVAAVTGFSYSTYHMHEKISAKQAENKELHRELTTVTDTKSDLEQQIKLLNDDDYVLNLARKEYHFSKPGEIIYPMQ